MIKILYTGSEDLTEWLARHSLDPPSLIMHVARTGEVNIGLELDGNTFQLYLAKEVHPKLCKPNRLWFVLPLSLVVRNATFDDGSPIE